MSTVPKWPKTMPITEPREFVHGHYSNQCGTRFCAVGQLAHSFGLNAEPIGIDPRSGDRTSDGWAEDARGGLDSVAPIGSPMHRFARRFAVNLGADVQAFDRQYEQNGLRALEWVFEYGHFRGMDEAEPTARETSDAWNKAVRQSGYTRELAR